MTSSEPEIRVLLVDDHAIVRKGVRALLQSEPGITVVGEAQDGESALVQAGDLRPDVILMDLMMPGMDGVEAIKRLLEQNPAVRIVVVTSFATDDRIFPAIKAGALGYLLKDSDPEDLVRAIRQAHRGEGALHPAIARKVLQQVGRPESTTRADAALTEREVAVLKLVAQGMSNQEIASELVVSETTVRTHVSSILAKLHLASRTQAALYAVREGIAPLPDRPGPAPR